jgi:hypothetical protein
VLLFAFPNSQPLTSTAQRQPLGQNIHTQRERHGHAGRQDCVYPDRVCVCRRHSTDRCCCLHAVTARNRTVVAAEEYGHRFFFFGYLEMLLVLSQALRAVTWGRGPHVGNVVRYRSRFKLRWMARWVPGRGDGWWACECFHVGAVRCGCWDGQAGQLMGRLRGWR